MRLALAGESAPHAGGAWRAATASDGALSHFVCGALMSPLLPLPWRPMLVKVLTGLAGSDSGGGVLPRLEE